MNTLLPYIAIIIGFVFLVWGADRFVAGASAVATNMGVSPLLVGLVIVGFGTSAPEMLVSGVAAMNDNPGLSIGNAIGSNIANIGLVLGLTAIIAPLEVHSSLVKKELPILLGIMIAVWFLIQDGWLGTGDGVILICAMIVMMGWIVYSGLKLKKADPIVAEYADDLPTAMTTKKAVLWLFVGLIVLVGSSKVLVWGAVEVAHYFGISDLIIGLTIISIGTSLPELAATIMSALKKEYDMALGNIIGSNMFNLLGVLALPGLISPSWLADDVLSRDYPIMLAFTVFLLIIAYGFKGPGRINRFEGVVLLSCFTAYMFMLYKAALA